MKIETREMTKPHPRKGDLRMSELPKWIEDAAAVFARVPDVEDVDAAFHCSDRFEGFLAGARAVLERVEKAADEREPLVNFALHDELRDSPRKFEFYMMGRESVRNEVLE